MKIIFLTFSIILLFHNVVSNENPILSCTELKGMFLGSLFHKFSKPKSSTKAVFYLAVKGKESVKIEKNNWAALQSNGFDTSRKTYFIIHGFMSSYKKAWITDLKNNLIDKYNTNLILIDWSDGSQDWNYVNAVQRTIHVAQELVKFLGQLKVKVIKLKGNSHGMWNYLYFIGHSLGAHISGQAGNLLKKKDNFYKVERITGLDPAQPCFKAADRSLKLDKSDANLVDVIHTQTGRSDGTNGFGLVDPIGDIDYYVNGGIIQPQCESSTTLYTKISRMICSHSIASRYFVESVQYSMSDNCKFFGHKWNATYSDAIRILHETDKGSVCEGCPEMGINSSKYSSHRGAFLVITSSKSPYCEVAERDLPKLYNALKKLDTDIPMFEEFVLTDISENIFDM